MVPGSVDAARGGGDENNFAPDYFVTSVRKHDMEGGSIPRASLLAGIVQASGSTKPPFHGSCSTCRSQRNISL